jgi:hypothetical protein
VCEADHRGAPEESGPGVKPGTHCGICGKLMDGKPHPGADVYHMDCMMETTKHLRERNDRGQQTKDH